MVHRFILAVLIALFAAPHASATWSIVVIDRRTGEMAVATSTCLPGFDISVAVPVIRVGFGAGAAQSFVPTSAVNRRRIFQNIDREGAAPQALLDFIEANDPSFQLRQFGLVSVWGPPATFTGSSNFATALGVVGAVGDYEYAIQGNILTGNNVVFDCEAAFVNTPGDLGQRVMAAMEAARDAGGDGRCSCTTGSATSCGSPPPSFVRASTNAFLALVRLGDVDGSCAGQQGCATGDYYCRINLISTASAPEPILTLRQEFESWRAALAGRPDHLRSTVDASFPRLQADGLTTSRVVVGLVDADGVPLTVGGQSLSVERISGDDVADVVAAVDLGNGTHTFDLQATTVVGTAEYAIVVDDGVRPVRLSPALRVESIGPRELHAGRQAVSASTVVRLPLVVDRGPAAAGQAYRIFGSLSGTAPGTLVNGVLLPVNRDRLFDFTARTSGGAPFQGSAGLLDASGRASAELEFPGSALSAFVGSSFSFVAAVSNAGTTEITNVTEVRFVP